MKFLRRNRYSLLVLGVLGLAMVLAANQRLANQTGHLRLREDFLLMHFSGRSAEATHLYQKLVPSIARLSDLELIRDLDRLELLMLLHPEMNVPDNLLYKFRAGVRVELERREPARVAKALQRAGLGKPAP